MKKGGELTDEEWDDMENEKGENNLDENGSGNMNMVDDIEEHENLDETEAARDQADVVASSSVQESETAYLDLKIKADLESLSRIGCVVDTGKNQSPVKLLPYLVKMENVSAKERPRSTMQSSRESKEIKSEHDKRNDIIDDNNAFDIYNK